MKLIYALVALCVLSFSAYATPVVYPSLIFKNQFGEQTNARVIGGNYVKTWSSCTIGLNVATNITGAAADCRCVGDTFEAQGYFAATGASAAVTVTMTLPAGEVIDPSKMPSSGTTDQAAMMVGDGSWKQTGVAFRPLMVFYASTTTVQVAYADGRLLGTQLADGDSVKYRIEVPVVGCK